MSHDDTIISTISTDICALPGITGGCRALIDKWYYNKYTSECKYFTYSGCGGNNNNFETLKSCQETCMDIKSTIDSDLNTYHIAGFVMIFVVIYTFFILYYLSTKKGNKPEPHQYRIVIKDIQNKYNKRGCLYVSNIAKKVFQSDIKQLFEDYGQIIEFDFKETRGDQLNICFIQFKSIADGNKAMNELNGMTIEQHQICIKPGSEYKPMANPVPPKQIYKKPKTETKTVSKTQKTVNKFVKLKKRLDTISETLTIPTNNSDQNNSAKAILKRIETMENLDDLPNVKIVEDKIDIDMDISAIIENKNKFISANPISPSGPSENIYSTSMSMHQIDSDFQYYDANDNDGIQMSDSDMIDYADNEQIYELKQFVEKKLTIDESNIDDRYKDYVGIDMEED